jgi:pseudouridine-5'-phosphate glycosidase
MPFPQNLQTAREVEEVVRNAGAEPATIAILDGRACVGTHKQHRRLTQRTNLASALDVLKQLGFDRGAAGR